MMSDDPTDELLFRFIAERCSASERELVEAWLRDPANGRRLDDIRAIWLASRATPSRDVDRMWTRLRAELDDADQPGDADAGANAHAAERAAPHPSLTGLSGRAFSSGTWAAALAAVAATAALVVSLSHPDAPAAVPAAAHTYATGPAQTANVRLRDGTRVTLAPQSRLSVPDDFGARERSVTLDGEGFFDVVHDKAVPFRVLAKNATAEDIGTRFEVSAYQDEAGVTVIVADGAVTLGHLRPDSSARGAEGVVVKRGERARAGGPDGTITVDRVSLDLVAWKEGRLSFVKTPLSEIARTIGRWYDLDVRIADGTLRQRPITADFDTQSPKEMIGALATAIGGRVEQQGRVLTIRMSP
jgi:ferric-dicitrate binding protein FerR (iron transport regulator)